MAPEKIDSITAAAYIQRVRAAAIEAKFIEKNSLRLLIEQFELSGFSAYASLTFKKGAAECIVWFDVAIPPVHLTQAQLYRDEQENLMSRDYIVTRISWPFSPAFALSHANDMIDVLTDATEFACVIGEPCFVTKLVQTREECVAAEIACAKEAIIRAIELTARSAFARKRRASTKMVWHLTELSDQAQEQINSAMTQLRKNKVDTWAHTFDNDTAEISIVMTPCSITFIATKIA